MRVSAKEANELAQRAIADNTSPQLQKAFTIIKRAAEIGKTHIIYESHNGYKLMPYDIQILRILGYSVDEYSYQNPYISWETK